eukprot:4874290-Amphidinium_carterae.1
MQLFCGKLPSRLRPKQLYLIESDGMRQNGCRMMVARCASCTGAYRHCIVCTIVVARGSTNVIYHFHRGTLATLESLPLGRLQVCSSSQMLHCCNHSCSNLITGPLQNPKLPISGKAWLGSDPIAW